MGDQALDAAERFRERKGLNGFDKTAYGVDAAAQLQTRVLSSQVFWCSVVDRS